MNKQEQKNNVMTSFETRVYVLLGKQSHCIRPSVSAQTWKLSDSMKERCDFFSHFNITSMREKIVNNYGNHIVVQKE